MSTLQKISETSYLTAENAERYRCIMRVFYNAYEQMNFQLLKRMYWSVCRRNIRIDRMSVKTRSSLICHSLSPGKTWSLFRIQKRYIPSRNTSRTGIVEPTRASEAISSIPGIKKKVVHISAGTDGLNSLYSLMIIQV